MRTWVAVPDQHQHDLVTALDEFPVIELDREFS